MQVILSQEEYETLKSAIPRLEISQAVAEALYDLRAMGVHEDRFNNTVKIFNKVGDRVGFQVRPDWTPYS